MEKVKKFYDALAKDEGMQARLAKLSEKYEGAQPSADAAAADLIEFATSEGHAFTKQELDAFGESVKKDGVSELCDDELEAVAGGNAVQECGPRCWHHECVCVFGGGGNHGDPRITCACVFGGGGKKCSTGRTLVCPLIGGTALFT